MTAYDFPSSPIDGQLYPSEVAVGQTQYRYSSTSGAWLINTPDQKFNQKIVSLTAPTSRTDGSPLQANDEWFKNDTGATFLYYAEGGPGQWLQTNVGVTVSPVTANDFIFQARLSIHATDALSGGSGGSIYLHPYNGNRVGLFNTTDQRWILHEVTSPILFNIGTCTDNLPYDLFLYLDSGSLVLEKVAWTDALSRTSTLAEQDGIKVKSSAPDRRYVGTFFSRGSNTIEVTDTIINQTYNAGFQTAIGYIGLINHYNSVPWSVTKSDFSTAARQLQNSTSLYTTTPTLMYASINSGAYSKFAFAGTGFRDRSVDLDATYCIYRSTGAFLDAAWHRTWVNPATLAGSDFIGGRTAGTTDGNAKPTANTTSYSPVRGYNTVAIIGHDQTNSMVYSSCSMTVKGWY